MEKNKILILVLLSTLIILSAGIVSAAQSAVNLGTAGNFIILTKSGISTTGTTSIVGNIGSSPVAATYITAFGLIMDSSNQFATSSLVNGKVYAADYTGPTPSVMTTAISDMETAYTDAAGRTLPDYTELGAGNIGGMTLTPGLYKWGTDVTIPTDVTLSGNSNDIWIFQIAGTLDISSATQIKLIGGAQAKNIFWQVAGQTTLGTTSVFNGNILDQTAIVLNTGATLNGRALAQTAVTLDSNTVSLNVNEVSLPPPITSSGDTGSSSSGSTEITPTTTSNPTSGNAEGTAEVTSSKESGTIVEVTTPKGIINIVPGVSATITRDSKTIEVTSADGKKRLNSEGIKVETELPVEVEGDIVRVTQSNGAKSEIKIMPVTASATAIARLKLKVCTEENNCTITLKEVGTGADTKVVYQLKAQKNVKVLGLFKAKMNVETNVDAETNEIISTKIPWWSLISVDDS